LSGQLAELRAAGCAKVYSEKASGARGDRAELRKVIDRLEPGDVLVVTRLDRLARSTRDLLNVLESVKQAGAGFRSLKDTWADTTTPHGQLMLTILGGLAEFERTLIRARTGEGRERAKARGARFGRPKKLSAHQRREAIDRINAGEAVAEVARTFGVDRATVYRLRGSLGYLSTFTVTSCWQPKHATSSGPTPFWRMLAKSIGSILYLDGRGAIGHHSTSRARIIAGLSGFLTLSQSRDRPDL
jgi:DNA invertase Pin-like site-specific DNA recombinase